MNQTNCPIYQKPHQIIKPLQNIALEVVFCSLVAEIIYLNGTATKETRKIIKETLGM